MIAVRSYSPCEASILTSYTGADDYFAGSVETTINPSVFVDHGLGSATALLQKQLEIMPGAVTLTEALRKRTEETVIGAAYESDRVLIIRADPLSNLYRLSLATASQSSAGTTQEVTQAEASAWYVQFHYLSASKRIREALDILFQYVEDAFDVSDFHKLDCMLRKVNPSDLSAEMLISVLRATSRAKSSLPKWRELLEMAKGKVESEGLPPRLLRGL